MTLSLSLRTRFAATFALSIVLGAGLLSAAIGARSSTEVRSGIGRSLTEIAYHMADKLDRGMWARSGEVALLASMVGLNSGDVAAVRHSLNALQHSIPIFAWIGFTDPSGRVLAATGGVLEGADISKRPVYRNGVTGTFVGDVHEALLLAKLLPNPTGEAMKFVDISTPVTGADGRVTGVLATHLSWAWAREVRDSILAPMDGRHDMQVFVVASDNTVLLGPDDAIGGKLFLDAVERARKGDAGWVVECWPDGTEYLTGYAFGAGHQGYGGLGWTVLARQPLATAYAPVRAMQRDIMLWGCGVAALFALFGWLVAGGVAAPLRRIAQVADRLRAGEHVEIPAHRGIRDIETLSASLRALIASLTASEAARSHAEGQASRDRLTGLANRLAMEAHLEQALAAARRSDSALALLCLDLDGFKAVNDTMGHHAGDVLLQQVAERLRHCARGGDLVARLGGDEFIMVLATPAGDALKDGIAVGGRIIAALGQPFDLEGVSANIGCSVGVAAWPDHGDDFQQVMRLADQALYAAKRAGKNRVTAHAPEPIAESAL